MFVEKILLPTLVISLLVIIPYFLFQLYAHISNKGRIEIYADCLISFCFNKEEQDFNFYERVKWLKDEIDAYHIPSIKVWKKAVAWTKITNKIDNESKREQTLQTLYFLEKKGFTASATNLEYILRETKPAVYFLVIVFALVLISAPFRYWFSDSAYYKVTYFAQEPPLISRVCNNNFNIKLYNISEDDLEIESSNYIRSGETVILPIKEKDLAVTAVCKGTEDKENYQSITFSKKEKVKRFDFSNFAYYDEEYVVFDEIVRVTVVLEYVKKAW